MNISPQDSAHMEPVIDRMAAAGVDTDSLDDMAVALVENFQALAANALTPASVLALMAVAFVAGRRSAKRTIH